MTQPVHTKLAEAETLDFPGALSVKILLSGDQTGGTLSVFEDIVQPDVGPPLHIHEQQDETFLFLEGQFDVMIDGTLHHMSPGDVGFIPRGVPHAFCNVGGTVGRLRYIFSPALLAEDMFRAFHAALGDDALTPEDITEIAKSYGQTVVGPPLRGMSA